MYDENGMFIGVGPVNAGLNYKSPYGKAKSLGEFAAVYNPQPTGFDSNLQSAFSGSFQNQAGFPASPQAKAFNFTTPQAPITGMTGPTSTNPTAKAAAGGGGGSMLGVGSAVLGGVQTIGGLIGLLSTKEPEGYSLTADNRMAIAEGKREAQFGLSDTQRSAFNTGVREQTATDLFNARNLAGNSLSRAVFGLRRGATLGELNRLAVADFNAMQQKRRYRDTLFGLEQGVQDRNTGLDWNVYNQKMQAYGGALQSGLTNMASFFNLGQAMNYLPGLAG